METVVSADNGYFSDVGIVDAIWRPSSHILTWIMETYRQLLELTALHIWLSQIFHISNITQDSVIQIFYTGKHNITGQQNTKLLYRPTWQNLYTGQHNTKLLCWTT